MGQKANPISLRLRTTNKTFASYWYSDFYYSNIIAQELKTREYLSKLFAQIRYPTPCLSISFLPKRTKTLLIYLNPFQSRRRGCERFQLRVIPKAGSFDPSIVFTRKNDAMTASTLANRGDSLIAPLMARGSMATPGHRGDGQRAPDVCNTRCKQIMGEKYKEVFLEKLLLLTALHKVTSKELIWKKDHQFFQKLHHVTWFQGREENQSLLSSKELSFSVPLRRPGAHWPPLQRPGVANEPHSFPLTSSAIGNNYKVTYSKVGLSFAERWSEGNEREIEGGPQLTNRESLLKLERLLLPSDVANIRLTVDSLQRTRGTTGVVNTKKLKNNESTSFLSYQLTNRKKDHIHLAHLESIISKGLASPTTLHLYKSADETQAAHFMSDQIAYYLERRVPFRRIKQLLLRELKTYYIEGVRVICSGRVGGRSKKAQRARGERFQWGQTSSHVFSSKLSFSSRSALTPFGKVGIKVWICYK